MAARTTDRLPPDRRQSTRDPLMKRRRTASNARLSSGRRDHRERDMRSRESITNGTYMSKNIGKPEFVPLARLPASGVRRRPSGRPRFGALSRLADLLSSNQRRKRLLSLSMLRWARQHYLCSTGS